MLLKASDKPIETEMAEPPDKEADNEAAPAMASMEPWLRAVTLTLSACTLRAVPVPPIKASSPELMRFSAYTPAALAEMALPPAAPTAAEPVRTFASMKELPEASTCKSPAAFTLAESMRARVDAFLGV